MFLFIFIRIKLLVRWPEGDPHHRQGNLFQDVNSSVDGVLVNDIA